MKKIIIFIYIILAILGAYYIYIKDPSRFSPEISKFENSLSETLKLVENVEKNIYNPPPLIGDIKNNTKISFLTKEGVLNWTNIARHENGPLPALSGNELLDTIANERLDDMFSKQYFEHISPSGIGVSDIAKKDSYEYITIGENIALGNFKNDQALVQAWMDSPGHRANMLNARYTEIGIAVRKGLFKGEETWLGIQVFALPLSACPSPDEALKIHIDSNRVRISELERSANDMKNELDQMDPVKAQEVKVYNEKVREHNLIIAEINKLIDSTKNLIMQFNSEVDAFNSCAKGK